MIKPSHLINLKIKHLKMDHDIEQISTSAFFSETKLHEMKKQKLKLKEEIEKISHDPEYLN